MKKFYVSFLLAAMLLMNFSVAYADFSDVTTDHLYYDAIMYIQEEGIVEGYPDGTYKPDITINRAEFTKIIVEAAVGTPGASIERHCFPDVDMEDDWFYMYVCFAKGKGWIHGYPDGYFRPGQPVNFAEAAKIVVNTFGYPVESIEPWYKPYVDVLDEKNVIPPTVVTFDQNITRGEMAEMIYRLKNDITYKPSNSYSELDADNWETYFDNSIGYEIKYPSGYSVSRDSSETVEMSRMIDKVLITSMEPACGHDFDGYCFEKTITIRVYNNQGSQTLDQFFANEQYKYWEQSSVSTIDGQRAITAYPKETELHSYKYIFAGGNWLADNIYQYFFDVQITTGFDDAQHDQIMSTFRFRR